MKFLILIMLVASCSQQYEEVIVSKNLCIYQCTRNGAYVHGEGIATGVVNEYLEACKFKFKDIYCCVNNRYSSYQECKAN